MTCGGFRALVLAACDNNAGGLQAAGVLEPCVVVELKRLAHPVAVQPQRMNPRLRQTSDHGEDLVAHSQGLIPAP